jgi:hypothetical protein
MFHGTCDYTVLYKEAPLFNCNSPVEYMLYNGSFNIAEKLNKIILPMFYIPTKGSGMKQQK